MSSSSTVCPNPKLAGGEDRRRGEERETTDILPLELWTEILVRLPVLSLLFLKSVSKTFLSLIQNPNFVHLHFSLSLSDNSRLLLLKRPHNTIFDYWKFLVARSNKSPTETTEFKFRIHGDDIGVIGRVDGFLLLDRYDRESASNDMILCNPSIGKWLTIPPSPFSHLGRTRLEFGYDPMNNDYKVVSIVYVKDDSRNPEPQEQVTPSTLVEVYSLRAASWRTIGSETISYGWVLMNHVYVNGALHWLAKLGEHNDISHIVSFDLGTELFSYKEVPDLGIHNNDDYDPTYDEVNPMLVLFHGSLAVFHVTPIDIAVWVMRESGWTKACSVQCVSDLQCVSNLYSYLYDEARRIFSIIFSEESNELVVAGYYGMVSYNIKTQQFKYRDPDVTYADKYVDSLLWIDTLLPLEHQVPEF